MKKPKVKKRVAIPFFLIFVLVTVIFLGVLLVNITDYGITIASFGASIFVILKQNKVDKRKIFGAYAVGIIMGYASTLIPFTKAVNASIAAVLSVVLMTFMELQHAPAIGMSVAMVLKHYSLWTDFVILLCIFFLFGGTLLLKYLFHDPDKMSRFIEIENEKIDWKFRERDFPDYLKV